MDVLGDRAHARSRTNTGKTTHEHRLDNRQNVEGIMDKDLFGNQVVEAFAKTNKEQREAVAENLAGPARHYWKAYAALLKIDADALLVASLLEVEHESVCTPRGLPKFKSYTKLRPLALKYALRPVDKSAETVDNSV